MADFCRASKPNAMTILVPLDFSSQSINAASFAARMLSGVYGAKLVLYHLYPSDAEERAANERLEKVKAALLNNSPIQIRCVAEKGSGLVYSLTKLVNREDANLVVMSVSDRVKIFEDSYSLQMMAQSNCPVLVIPYGYLYTDVKSVVLASDFKDAARTIPAAKVKKLLDIFHPQLHIVHVNPEIYVSLTADLETERQHLEEMFGDYRPQFHFLTTNGFSESLERFIDDHSIDLVLTFPRKHSFLSSLIKGTNTKKLVYRNAVPVLAAHD